MNKNKLYLLAFCFLALFQFAYAQQLNSNAISCACKETSNQNTTYEGKVLVNVDFRNIKLSGYSFKGSTLKGCTFDGMELSQVNFKNAAIDADDDGNRTSFSGATFKEVCFQDAYINKADFQYCTFEKVDFQHASIYDAYFGNDIQFKGDNSCRTNFSNSTMKVNKPWYFPLNKLKEEYWGLVDFSYTNFFGLSTDNFQLEGKHFTDAILRGIQLENFTISSATFKRADLSGANFNYANLSQAVFEDAILKEVSFMHVSGIKANFKNAVLYKANLRNANFSQADFTGTKLGGARLINSEMSDVNFKRAQFSGDKTKSIYQAVVSNSNFSNSIFYEAEINEVDFTGSTFRKVKFSEGSGTTISKTSFNNSLMEEAVFQDATLEGVNFTGALLTNANFRGTTLRASSSGTPVSFKCALLAGADLSGNFQAVNFFNAIVPVKDKGCCKVKGADEITCGSSYLNTIAKLTRLSESQSKNVTCPDGNAGPCDQNRWANYSPEYCNNIWTQGKIWNKPNCDSLSPPSDQVKFTDPNLENAIKKYLRLSPEKPITKVFAETVRSLDCSGKGIKNLGGLEAFTALEKLILSHNEIVDGDFSSLSQELIQLKVEHNRLTALKLSSSGQKELKVLDASNNQLTEVKGLIGKQLIMLDLSYNQLTKPLKLFLKSELLVHVDLSNNQIRSSGNDLKKLKEIERLYLQHNQLKKIGSLKKFTKLKSIDLSGNNGFDCNSLSPYPDKKPNIICP